MVGFSMKTDKYWLSAHAQVLDIFGLNPGLYELCINFLSAIRYGSMNFKHLGISFPSLVNVTIIQ